MTWTTPRTWATGEIVTAAMLNSNIRDNLIHLYDNIYDETLISAGDFSVDISGASDYAAYKSLTIVASLRSTQILTGGDSVRLRFNGDTGNNYDFQHLISLNGTLSTNDNVAQNHIPVGMAPRAADAGGTEPLWITIPNFNLAGKAKIVNAVEGHCRVTGAAGSNWVMMVGGLWRTTNAITSVSLESASGADWAGGSRLTIYGDLL